VSDKPEIVIKIDQGDTKLEEKLSNLPKQPGIYQYKNSDGKIIYVGKAKNLRNRVRQYFQNTKRLDAKTQSLVAKISDVELIVTDSEVEALILEAVLIKKYKPKYNIFLRDDKSYPYIVVTNEPFPRVFVTRRIIQDGSKYFGPYTDVKNLRASLKMIHDVFKVRSCNYHIDVDVIRKRKIRVCLDYHIKKCEGPCEGIVNQDHYNRMIKEVIQVLRGKTESLISELRKEMEELSETFKFEEAADRRDKIRGLQNYNERQKVVDADLMDRDIFAVASEDDDACGVVFKIRDGKIIGRQHFYMSSVEGAIEQEIVSQLVRRFYLESDYIPKEIYLPVEIQDSVQIQKWFTDKRGEKVSIVVPKIGDKAKLMGMCKANAKYLLDDLKIQKIKRSEHSPKILELLQKDLHLRKLPVKIECFDISNIQGEDAAASLVVFENGKPKKSEYRRFKIKTVVGPDDFASMREVIDRHYSKVVEDNLQMPDLIVVDGGKGQLSSAVEILQQLLNIEYQTRPNTNTESRNIPIIGLAKRLEEIYFPNINEPQSIPRTSASLKLLQRIRDEAHRFAVDYHRKLRSKRTLQTELDLIKGVGKKRSKELLEAFGSVQGVKFATSEQITEIVGEKVADKIKEYFEVV
jgi:excinuclease ABC subunit C